MKGNQEQRRARTVSLRGVCSRPSAGASSRLRDLLPALWRALSEGPAVSIAA